MTDLVKKTKLTELENRIPDIGNLASKNVLTTVENKIPSVVKKTDYKTKITELKINLIIIMKNILILKSLIN